jgi:hypothetical protein
MAARNQGKQAAAEHPEWNAIRSIAIVRRKFCRRSGPRMSSV